VSPVNVVGPSKSKTALIVGITVGVVGWKLIVGLDVGFAVDGTEVGRTVGADERSTVKVSELYRDDI